MLLYDTVKLPVQQVPFPFHPSPLPSRRWLVYSGSDMTIGHHTGRLRLVGAYVVAEVLAIVANHVTGLAVLA